MLETIAIILIVLWVAGLLTSYTMGGLIHVLLVIAIVVVLIRVIQGRRLQQPWSGARQRATRQERSAACGPCFWFFG